MDCGDVERLAVAWEQPVVKNQCLIATFGISATMRECVSHKSRQMELNAELTTDVWPVAASTA